MPKTNGEKALFFCQPSFFFPPVLDCETILVLNDIQKYITTRRWNGFLLPQIERVKLVAVPTTLDPHGWSLHSCRRLLLRSPHHPSCEHRERRKWNGRTRRRLRLPRRLRETKAFLGRAPSPTTLP